MPKLHAYLRLPADPTISCRTLNQEVVSHPRPLENHWRLPLPNPLFQYRHPLFQCTCPPCLYFRRSPCSWKKCILCVHSPLTDCLFYQGRPRKPMPAIYNLFSRLRPPAHSITLYAPVSCVESAQWAVGLELAELLALLLCAGLGWGWKRLRSSFSHSTSSRKTSCAVGRSAGSCATHLQPRTGQARGVRWGW